MVTIDKPLKIAFLFSVGLHSVLFSPLLSFIGSPPKIPNTNIEVTYIAKPIPIDDARLSLQKQTLRQAQGAEQTGSKKPLTQAEKAEREEVKKELKEKVESVQREPLKESSIKREAIDLDSISLSQGESDSLNYLRAIRNKINLYVHRNYNLSMGEGEVFLHFVLNSDGSVQCASIIKDNLDNNESLRKLCLDSIYLSSPFNPFPKNLDLSQATFNICISFKKR